MLLSPGAHFELARCEVMSNLGSSLCLFLDFPLTNIKCLCNLAFHMFSLSAEGVKGLFF